MENSSIKLSDPAVSSALNAWENCLQLIRADVSAMTYMTWFAPTKGIEINDNRLRIAIPNAFWIEYIEQRYSNLILNSVREILGEGIAIDYIVSADAQSEESSPKNQDIPIEIHRPAPLFVQSDGQRVESNLQPEFTFVNFIKGSGNELATAAASAIAAAPGETSFNPLFIYGGVGLGKTHLAMAIGNEVLSLYQNKRVQYLSSERFFAKYVDAIKSNQGHKFQELYEAMDVLILDDVQFFIGRDKTQEMFFHIFNILHQNKKQIILTSDKAPKDLNGLDDRLISRFNWGLSVDIQPPDFETRLAILNSKSEEYKLNLPEDYLEYIARNITSNIRELQGCLIRLHVNLLISKQLNFELIKETVQQISTSRRMQVSIELITKCVCEELNIDENKLRDKSRKQEIVLARQLSMYLTKQLTRLSLKNIGLYFGGRDHTTVLHSNDTIQKYLEDDSSFRELVNKVKHKIQLSCS